MKKVPLSTINHFSGTSINPMESPDQIYELYSVPSFDSNYPEIIKGSEIGSTKVVVEENDVLICKINPRINRVWVVKHNTPHPLLASSEWICVRNNDMNPNYLKWYFSSPTFRTLMVSQVTGIGGSLTRAQPKQVAKYPVPMYSIEMQNQIATTFDEITAIIDACNQQLLCLDELIESRFIEMFGDPMLNPMGWDEVNISTVVGGKVSNGFFAKREEYCDDGNVKVLGVVNVVNRMYSGIDNLPATKGTNADIQKYGVKYGDMLFCRSSLVAAGIGKASVVPKETPNNVLFECHVIRLPLDLNKCVPEFMQVLSTTNYFRNQVISQSKTATMTTIGQDGILKTNIVLPPLELQKQFLEFVEQTNATKESIQKNLSELEELKCNLMQQYFG